ncbi:hypothetical protein CLOM_g10140 [Closterium sp. NIES-68]|nr:hypothetical protein CLOM_g17660 [Closterium sp. NIES-68]GJP50987.1 hypothetical protein CLOM_g10140 [Closterium sp. NIES-68]GJP61230.1 hypothetical protein CLOP_g18416 [Closterium sp. NIES-67]GJP66320.1 hypothetical protein CLOP_g23227 [Closterium sp. NIES-67]GJP83687.1 hypothetical protein CLOP_g13814 [Closterium sp. NIES-67]
MEDNSIHKTAFQTRYKSYEERFCHQEGLIVRIHGEHSRSPRRPEEDRSCTYVEDAREREGVAAATRLHQLLQQIHATQHKKVGAPHTNLLKNNTPYQWEPRHQEAAGHLKQALMSAPVLILPDPECDYVIEVDTSDQAVGAVLMQDQGNGMQPIAYLGKKNTLARAKLPDTRQGGPCYYHRLQNVEMLSQRTKNDCLRRPLKPKFFEDTAKPLQATCPVA